jgi:hypothetical protein
MNHVQQPSFIATIKINYKKKINFATVWVHAKNDRYLRNEQKNVQKTDKNLNILNVFYLWYTIFLHFLHLKWQADK